LTESSSKVTKDFYFKCCSFERPIHQRILETIYTVFWRIMWHWKL